MKKTIISVAACTLLLYSIHIKAQIGINTDNPLALFHIDPKNDTTDSGQNSYDDIVVDNNGSLGLGMIEPLTKLSIRTSGTATAPVSGLRIKDGSQAEDYLLTATDNIGNANWQKMLPIGFQKGVLASNGGITLPTVISSGLYTGSTLTLPPGSWIVNVVIILSQITRSPEHDVWVKTTFSNSPTIFTQSADIQGSPLISGSTFTNGQWAFVKGTVIIKNSTTAAKTYYYVVSKIDGGVSGDPSFTKFGGGANDENVIIAYQLDE